MVSSQCLPPLYHRFPWSTSQILLNLDHERSEKGCGNWIWFRRNQWCGHHQEKILVLMVSSFLYFCIGLFYWAPCSCSIWKVFMPIVNSSTGAIFFTIRSCSGRDFSWFVKFTVIVRNILWFLLPIQFIASLTFSLKKQRRRLGCLAFVKNPLRY